MLFPSLFGGINAAVVIVVISLLVLVFISRHTRRGMRLFDVLNVGLVTRQAARTESPQASAQAEDLDSFRARQGLTTADARPRGVDSRRSPQRFTPLAADPAARSLLESMREETERIRRKRGDRIHIVDPAPSATDAETRYLRNEVENLRRENEMFRYLQSHATLATPPTSTPDDAPPPYTLRDEPLQS
ncbi:hypothetical protein LshimejAT787_0904570 [Lyophyllum shimeji]|uniref:Uncharacterized protein n=1 Tax=Lyophyllum shimeji TaxID=47721 RepID=A0A9P3PR85_LYOSH|nr:hypothetical protein LshimejAT787_0904570 [Lyophyllum shimeji]